MKQQVVYVHGGDSFSKNADFLEYLRIVPLFDIPGKEVPSSWKRTLAAELGDDYEVFMPSMPNRQNAEYREWKIWFERYIPLLREGVIIIGGSLGGMFLAKFLSETTLPFRVGSLYLLAAAGGEYPSQADGNDCASFRFACDSAGQIEKTVSQINIWHSEDDHIVPVVEASWYQNCLPTAKVRIFKDKNHFLVPEFPELIAHIKENHL